MQGKIINITNKYVIVEDDKTKEILRCSLKGRFKKDKINFLVGDNVVYEKLNDEEGLVNELMERKNSLIRPPVSNVDQVILVFASKNPDISYEILDTFISVIENENIDIVLVINKCDLDMDGSNVIKDKYEKIGYNVILSSTKQNQLGLSEIKDVLKNKISVFAGPSGVGKSSILNEILEDSNLEVGDISDKTLRGKHTTKGTVLLPLKNGGSVFDTAGFTTIDLLNIDLDNLEYCFKEFIPHLNKCKFTSCKHNKEIGCEIKKQVEEGNISKERYEMFLSFQSKIENKSSHREKDNKIYKGKKVFISSKEMNKRGLKN